MGLGASIHRSKRVNEPKEALIKSVRGEPVEPFPFTPFDWLRTGFDKLRANGRLDQSFL